MKFLKWILALVVIVVVIVLVMRKGEKTVEPNYSGEPVKVGAIISETGPAASWGQSTKDALTMAVFEINQEGGVNGRQVKLKIEDDASTPQQAQQAWQKLVQGEEVEVVIGGLRPDTFDTLSQLAEEDGVVLISPSNFWVPGALEPNDQSFVMLPEAETVLLSFEDYLRDNSVASLSVVHNGDVFGFDAVRVFNELLNGNAKSHVVDAGAVNSVATAVKNDGTDAIFIDLLPGDAARFIQALRATGDTTQILTTDTALDAFMSDTTLDMSLLQGVYSLDWNLPSPAFLQAYATAFARIADNSSHRTYAALYAVMEAATARKSNETIAEYLAKNKLETPFQTIEFNRNHAVDDVEVVHVEWTADMIESARQLRELTSMQQKNS